MAEETKAVAPAAGAALDAPRRPKSMANLEAEDIVPPRIKLWHPQSEIAPDNVRLGDYVDQLEKKILGNTLRFFLVAQKTNKFTDEDTGEVAVYKHLLVYLEGNLTKPYELVFSKGGVREVKPLVTLLLTKAQAEGGELYSWLIKAESKTIEGGKGGKYSVPQFTIERAATSEEYAALDRSFDEIGAAFIAKPVKAEDLG